jgi:hypothetical protein
MKESNINTIMDDEFKYDNKEELYEEEEDVRLGFIKLIGEETDGYYRYEFIFTNNIDEFWGEDFNVKPAGLVNNLAPNDEYIYEIHIVKMKIKLDLLQNNCCFSYSDGIDGCVAIAIENMDAYDDFPEDGRIFFRFGETLDDVERKLAMKNVLMLN